MMALPSPCVGCVCIAVDAMGGLKPQQLQRYEATRYHSVSFRRLLEIARALDVDLSETVRLTR